MEKLLQAAYDFLNAVKSDLDPYTTSKGAVEGTQTGAILFTPQHIQFAKYGRGPGKQPPLDIIEAWVEKNGIIFDGLNQRGTAWVIARSIGKSGTKNWVPGAPNALEESLEKGWKEYQSKLLDFATIAIESEIEVLRVEKIAINQKFTI